MNRSAARTKGNKLLVTGGAGFIGSEFVRQAVHRGYQVVVIDKCTYAGNTARLADVWKHIVFYEGDIVDKKGLSKIFQKESPALVAHFAAETHVDRSILNPAPFWRTNLLGTQSLVEVCRIQGVSKFIHVSTDEVYGDIPSGRVVETAPLRPSNPYAASKAAADLLVQSAIRTYHFPAVIARPCNNYGPAQFPEKLIPLVISRAMRGKKIPVYGQGKNIREWLYVTDCCRALLLLLKKGTTGQIYNIGNSESSRQNLRVIKDILRQLKASLDLIEFVPDRPGHDFRYAMRYRKIAELGWRPLTSFSEGLIFILESIIYIKKNKYV